MTWPRQPDYRGLFGIFQAIRQIAGLHQQEAIDWANASLGLSLPPFSRVQWAARHTKKFPLLVVEPISGISPQGERTVEHQYSFQIGIYILGQDPDQMMIDLCGYFTAVQQLFMSATREEWVEFFEPGTAAFMLADCGEMVFGQIDTGEEESNLYTRGCGMQLLVQISEVVP